MRASSDNGRFQARAFAGTHVILIALTCNDSERAGLMGFAFKREVVGGRRREKFLNAQKVFKSIVPDPKAERDPNDPTQPRRYSTLEHPIRASCGPITPPSRIPRVSSRSSPCAAGPAASSRTSLSS